MNIIEGDYNGAGLRIAVLVSRFNETVTQSLRAGANAMLLKLGVQEADLTFVDVPGAFELPATAARIVAQGKYDAVICIGAVIRGATPHFDQVVSATTAGIARLSVEANIPVIFGVLTTDNVEQAMDRAGLKAGNKGAEAAMTAVEMARLYKKLS